MDSHSSLLRDDGRDMSNMIGNDMSTQMDRNIMDMDQQRYSNTMMGRNMMGKDSMGRNMMGQDSMGRNMVGQNSMGRNMVGGNIYNIMSNMGKTTDMSNMMGQQMESNMMGREMTLNMMGRNMRNPQMMGRNMMGRQDMTPNMMYGNMMDQDMIGMTNNQISSNMMKSNNGLMGQQM